MALTNDFIDSISTRGCPKRHNQKVVCAERTSSYENLDRFTCAQRTLQLGKTCITSHMAQATLSTGTRSRLVHAFVPLLL